MSEKIVDLKAFKGLRNVVADERFELGDMTAATNVYVDDSGQVTRRGGYQKVVDGTPRSLWSDNQLALFADGMSLKRLYPDLSTTTLTTLGSATAEVVYLKVNDRVYWTDGVATGVVEGGAARSWGLPAPTPALLTAVPGGLTSGVYGVTSTFVRADGQESGASAMVSVSGTRLSITFTDSPPADAVRRRVYVTAPDGEVPFAIGQYPAATPVVSYTVDASPVLPVETQFCGPPPAGQVLAEFYGHILVGSGSHLYYTKAFNYELVDYRSGVVTFNDPVRIVAPVNGGVYVSTTKETYFLAGTTPETWVKSTVAAYGGVLGTRAEAVGGLVGKGVGGRTQVWMSDYGVVVGADNGSFVNLTLDRYIPVSAQSGTSFVRVVDGSYYFITNLYY